MTIERFNVELRSEIQGRKIHGHASVFNQVADIGPHLEQIAPTAFRSTLANPDHDPIAVYNHDPSLLLGRRSSGTLRLGTDSEGLEFEVDLPDTTLGRDVAELMERGDITGASFAFLAGENSWSRTSDGRRLRSHTSVRRLVDVSVVTIPAYEGAGAALRSMNLAGAPDSRRRLILARASARAAYPRSTR